MFNKMITIFVSVLTLMYMGVKYFVEEVVDWIRGWMKTFFPILIIFFIDFIP